MDILFHLSGENAGPLLLGFGAACHRAGVSWACFLTNDGVKVLADKAVRSVLKDAQRTVVCEHSWKRHMGKAEIPVERGSQTTNSILMAEADQVVSL